MLINGPPSPAGNTLGREGRGGFFFLRGDTGGGWGSGCDGITGG